MKLKDLNGRTKIMIARWYKIEKQRDAFMEENPLATLNDFLDHIGLHKQSYFRTKKKVNNVLGEV